MRLRYSRVMIAVVLVSIFMLVAGSSFALDVLVNQTGYERYAPKVFRVQRTTDYAGNGTFTVKTSGGVDTCTGTLVRQGGLWNDYYWVGDFSSLTTDGNYYVSANVNGEIGTSYTFNVGVGSLLNKTGKLVYQYFNAQRCGAAVSLNYIDRNGNNVNWSHNACHLDDAYTNPSGPHIDGVGGWHDAGDYGKYGHGFCANPIIALLWLYDSNRSYYDAIDTNSNGIADILDEALWQARWLVKIVQANGHVMDNFGQRRTGASWVKPENDTDNVIGNSDDRWVYVGDENTPQETVAIAALIKMHRVLASKSLPTENFAGKALAIWNHRWQWAHDGGHNNLGEASSHIFGGLDLYAVYGQQNCWDSAIQKVQETCDNINNNISSYDNIADGTGAGCDLAALAWFARTYPNDSHTPAARAAVQTLMAHHMGYLASPQVGLIRRIESGSWQYFPANPNLGLNMLYGYVTWGAIEAYKTIGDASYLEFALDQYNWMLGANYQRVCMMEAAGTPGSSRYVDKYHSRYDTFIANAIEPGVVPNGFIRDGSGLPWIYFGTGSASVQTNEGWLPNSAGMAMALSSMTVFANSNESPYSGVINLPGTIQAENYDTGGEGIAYHDYSAGNSGGQYRSDNVDIEGCSDTGGGYDIGYIDSGEWMDYTVNPTSTGNYNLLMRVATPNTGGSFHIEMNGKNICSVTTVPNTGGWGTWQTVTVSGVSMNAGQQVLTVYVDNGAWNFNYLQVNAATGTNSAAYVSDTIPSTMNAGQTYPCTVTMQNNGTTTWTNGAGTADYNFGPWDAPAGPNINWAARADCSSNIAPGQQCTFNLSITPTAGTSPGSYNTTWGMVQEGVQWFQAMFTKPITISGTDATAPSFGGSISPSSSDVVFPVISITAQDTGTGLNVGSAEFVYSVDGGTSFGTYIGRYVLHSKGTGSGGGNRDWYPDFYHPTYTIASGDHLQYDIYSNNTDGTGSIDLEGSLGNLRDSGITDQNGLGGHSNTNLYTYDYHQWYHRDFNLTSKAGQTITSYEMAHETDSGVSEFYVRNVLITNNGLVKDRAANSDAWVPVSDTIAPGSNGYGTLVGPEMIIGDPASPASCTGSNGTTAQQTVTARFSPWGVMPLAVGGNNRIKFHISDMNANRAISSTFTVTVNATSTMNAKPAGTITIDGATSDWSLSQFTALSLGGQNQTGDTALIGFNGGTCYYGGYAGVLPTSASDHTAKVYSREDASYVYFLARCDDNDIRYSVPTSDNWQNDCVEFYIDPSHDGGSSPISNSTSDVQLVIDANNQKNVYCTTTGYATQVLNGVTSAVVRDGTGWWCEARIQKTALDPDLPAFGVIGLDLNFRDNDNNNDGALTTVYDWRGPSSGFPSKIPNDWGHCMLP